MSSDQFQTQHTDQLGRPSAQRTAADLRRVPFSKAVQVVAKREIMTRLKSKAFIITTIVFVVVMAGVTVLSSVGGDLFSSSTSVAATSQAAAQVSELPDVEVTQVGTEEEVIALIEDGTVDAGVTGSAETGYTVIAERESPSSLVQGLSVTPQVQLLDPNAPNPMIAYFVGLAFGMVFFMAAMTFGTTIAQSVVEEKQTRIVEILLAAIPARALLAGKILGTSVLAFGQVALIAAAVLGAGAATGSTLVLDGLGVPVLWFVALFLVGFVLIAALYAATAALVSRAEDLGSATGPVVYLIMIPYFLVIFFNNNPTVLAVMSYVPFSAPVAVPMRVFLGTSQWWEPLVSLGVLALTTMLVIVIAAKIYERSLLRTGSRVKIGEVLRQS